MPLRMLLFCRLLVPKRHRWTFPPLQVPHGLSSPCPGASLQHPGQPHVPAPAWGSCPLAPSPSPPARGSGAPHLSEVHSLALVIIIPQVISPCIGIGYGSGSTRYLTICWTNQFLQLEFANCDAEKTAWAFIAPHNNQHQTFLKQRTCWHKNEFCVTSGAVEKSHVVQLSAALPPPRLKLQTVLSGLERCSFS